MPTSPGATRGCVFCTVPDPVRGLREVHRVLEDGGLGPRINRRTLDHVRQAGFDVVEEHDVFSHGVKVIVARPRGADTMQHTAR